jgi:hypothetical protein
MGSAKRDDGPDKEAVRLALYQWIGDTFGWADGADRDQAGPPSEAFDSGASKKAAAHLGIPADKLSRFLSHGHLWSPETLRSVAVAIPDVVLAYLGLQGAIRTLPPNAAAVAAKVDPRVARIIAVVANVTGDLPTRDWSMLAAWAAGTSPDGSVSRRVG